LCLRFFSGDSRASFIESIAEDAAQAFGRTSIRQMHQAAMRRKNRHDQGRQTNFLRWLNTAKRRPLQQFPG
jgi:hypothetical protein